MRLRKTIRQNLISKSPHILHNTKLWFFRKLQNRFDKNGLWNAKSHETTHYAYVKWDTTSTIQCARSSGSRDIFTDFENYSMVNTERDSVYGCSRRLPDHTPATSIPRSPWCCSVKIVFCKRLYEYFLYNILGHTIAKTHQGEHETNHGQQLLLGGIPCIYIAYDKTDKATFKLRF